VFGAFLSCMEKPIDTEDDLANCKNGINKAHEVHKVPLLVDPVDMAGRP